MKIIGSKKRLEELSEVLLELNEISRQSEFIEFEKYTGLHRYFVSFEFLVEDFLVEENNEKNKISY